MKKLLTVVLGFVAFIGFSISTANAKTLKCQTVISAKADEVKMLKDFGKDVSDLTGGSLKFEIMPAGTVVGVKETLDAVASFPKSFNILTSSAFALITVWHFNVLALAVDIENPTNATKPKTTVNNFLIIPPFFINKNKIKPTMKFRVKLN